MIGLSAALVAREPIQRGDSLVRGAHLSGVVVMVSLLVVPLGIYLFFNHPTWSMLYWYEPLDVSRWHVLLIALGAPAAGALGYLTGAGLCRKFKPLTSVVACGLGSAGLVAVLVIYGSRLVHLSDTADWREAPSVLTGDLASVFAFALPMMLGAWVFLLVLYEVEGRKLHRSSGVRLVQLSGMNVPTPPSDSAADSIGLSMPELRSSVEGAVPEASADPSLPAAPPEAQPSKPN